MIIGFGSTETAFEEAEERAFLEFCDSQYTGDPDYVTADMAKIVDEWLKERARDLRSLTDGYKAAEDSPTRYSHYWAHTLNSATDIVAVFKFFHVNRKHALSPDGWAAMQTKRVAHWEPRP